MQLIEAKSEAEKDKAADKHHYKMVDISFSQINNNFFYYSKDSNIIELLKLYYKVSSINL